MRAWSFDVQRNPSTAVAANEQPAKTVRRHGRPRQASDVSETELRIGGDECTAELFAGSTAGPSRIQRRTTPARVTTVADAKIVKREAVDGDSAPDQPQLPEPAVVEDDTDVEDEIDEVEDEEETEPASHAESSLSSVDLSDVRAVVRVTGNRSSMTKREIKPTGAPTVNNNAAGGSDCTPEVIKAGDLTWSVVDKGKKGWGVQITALATRGHINVWPTPNLPTTKTAPNTPNPVDGGNIEDNEGSAADWRAVLRSLNRYHTKGGGRGPWHDTAASTAHEWAHWDTDWMKDALGSNWSTYRKKIKNLRVSKAKAADAGAARTALEPRVNAKIAAMNSKVIRRWNKIPDTPGDFFATGYLAGEKILKKHVDKVEKYATKKGWSLLGKVKKALTPGGGGGGGGVATPVVTT